MNNMINIEILKESDSLITEISNTFPDCDRLDVDSFGMESLVAFILPLATVLTPIGCQLIKKLIKDRNVTIKHNGIEISGDYEHVKEILEELREIEKKSD